MANTKSKALLLTAAVSGLLAVSACSATQNVTDSTVGKCIGVNSCKGHSDCASKMDGCDGKEGCQTMSSCKGHNSCKGKGFKKLSKKDCDAKGGKFEV